MKVDLSDCIFQKFILLPEIKRDKDSKAQRKFVAFVPSKHVWSQDSASEADKKCIINTLVSIVNQAYIVGEHSMWKENIRTNFSDIEDKLSKELLILLVSLSDDAKCDLHGEKEIVLNQNLIIGQILCNTQFDSEVQRAEFGMFAIRENYQNLGLGKFLVMAAEDRSKLSGCQSLQCEVLTPSNFEHDVKARLHLWYQKLGYQKEIEKDKEDNPVLLEDGTEKPKDFFHSFWTSQFAHIASNLAVECKLNVFVKDLT